METFLKTIMAIIVLIGITLNLLALNNKIIDLQMELDTHKKLTKPVSEELYELQKDIFNIQFNQD